MVDPNSNPTRMDRIDSSFFLNFVFYVISADTSTTTMYVSVCVCGPKFEYNKLHLWIVNNGTII